MSSNPKSWWDENLSIVAIILGALGLVAGLGALVLVANNQKSASALGAALPPRKEQAADVEEAKSLGSKLVN